MLTWVITGQALLFVLLILALWYTSTVGIYLKKKLNISKLPNQQSQKHILLKVMLLSGTLCLMSLILHNFILYIPTITMENCDGRYNICKHACDDMCTYGMNAWWVLFVAAESTVYLYLWIRMKLFYYKMTEDGTEVKSKTRPINWIAIW